jgi:hypothetical protein
MKKFILLLITFCTLNVYVFAQNNVQLNIHHKLNGEDFEMNMASSNNIDHNFNVTRMEYYISEISIIHDGGTETGIKDFWILANASASTQIDLGDHPIDAVEAIHFHIGVDPDHNHLDPSSWPAGHPLAPTFPSMHWGWTPGYRFIAYEGNGGNTLSQLCQLHGLGDDNYFKTEIPLTTTAQNNVVTINLDADYARALEDIALNGGVIVHGEDGEAKQALENFRDYVFSPSDNVNSTVDFSEVSSFNVFPNPTQSGATNFMVAATENRTYQVAISDILGRQIQYFSEVKSNTTIDLTLNNSGLFIVSLIKDGQTVISKKLISK